jgi:predicted GIY-YIG superfamily endonuclease
MLVVGKKDVMPKVPVLNLSYSPKYERQKVKLEKIKAKYKDEWRYTQDEKNILERLREISNQQMALKVEKAELRAIIKKRQLLRKQGRETTVKLYALRLDGGYWYIGMSYNPDKRFEKHRRGTGASWTRLHKPLSIHETRDTKLYDQDSAAKLEDDMTLEYALKYGSANVRGGGFCQQKPRWPDVIIQNEIIHS